MRIKCFSKAVLVILLSVVSSVWAEDSSEDRGFFEFEQRPVVTGQLDHAFVGFSGKDILRIGGYEIENREKTAVKSVFVLLDGAKKWTELAELSESLADGATVNTKKGIICVGGIRAGKASSAVVRYWLEKETLSSETMLSLPYPLVGAAAAIVSDTLYVVGDRDGSPAFLKLDMLNAEAAWEELPAWPGERLTRPAAVGLHGVLYLFGQKGEETKAYSYKSDRGWKPLASPPGERASVVAGSCGESHILIFSLGADGQDILGYHTISDKWIHTGVLPESVSPLAFTSQGTKFSLIGATQVIDAEAVLNPSGYSWINHVLVAVFMVGMLWVGWFLAKREKNSQDYFRAGRKIPWWAAGLSLFATGASAMSLMAMPGKAFSGDWLYFGFGFIIMLIFLPFSLLVFVPIARRLDVATANEYLERRFNLFLRLFASVIWSLIQILGRMAAVMLLPAFALSSIAGIPVDLSIILMGVITTLYVYLGGLSSVIWTDVIQAFIMIAAVVICVVWAAMSLNTEPTEIWRILEAENKLHMFNWTIDWTAPCVLVFVANVFVLAFGQMDQNFIQRIQSTPTERDAKKAAITQMAVAIPLNAVLFALGTVLYLFYRERPEMINPAVKADAVFPLFAAQNLPVGLAGLVMIAILAATMSTLSSALNSVANIGVEDFYRRLKKDVTDRQCLVLGHVLTAILGVFGTAAALVLAHTQLQSIWDLYLTILGLLLGAIAGIFTLGIFTKRATSGGAIAGAMASFVVVIYVKEYTHLHFMLYQVFGLTTCMVVGLLASFVVPSKKKDITGLTIYSLPKRDSELESMKGQ